MVLKPAIQVVVHQLARLQNEVSIVLNQLLQSLVEIAYLRDLYRLEQITQSLNLRCHSVVVVRNLMGFDLNLFALLGYLLVYLGEVFAEEVESVAELACSGSGLDFNVACERLDVVDVLGAMVHFDRQQLLIEEVLVGFLQEVDQELAASQDHRLHHLIKKSSVIDLFFHDLLVGKSLVLVHIGKWRDDGLREGSNEVVSQGNEVNI